MICVWCGIVNELDDGGEVSVPSRFDDDVCNEEEEDVCNEDEDDCSSSYEEKENVNDKKIINNNNNNKTHTSAVFIFFPERLRQFYKS